MAVQISVDGRILARLLRVKSELLVFRLQPMICAAGQEQMLEKIMTEDVKIRKEEKVNLSHVG